jgi:hypothetical protein
MSPLGQEGNIKIRWTENYREKISAYFLSLAYILPLMRLTLTKLPWKGNRLLLSKQLFFAGYRTTKSI